MECIVKKERGWHMTDGEIAVMYRQAANQNHQLRIIADLNAKTLSDVKDKIVRLGFELPQQHKNKTGKTNNDWTDDEVEMLKELRAKKLMFGQISSYFPRHSERSCRKKYWEIME